MTGATQISGGSFGTTIDAVQAILGGNYDCKSDLQPFLDTADTMVNQMLDCASQRGFTYTAEQLQTIEGWLSAHYYAQMDQLYKSKTTGGASAVFQGQTAMGLNSTLYGQQAISLDPSGCLASFSNPQVARGAWLGRPCCRGRTRPSSTAGAGWTGDLGNGG